MKKEKINTNVVKVNKVVFIFSFLLFLVIIGQLMRLSLSDTIDGINLKKFASNRNTEKTILYANRGTIYSANGDPLAQTIDSYTVIAYLDEKRSEGFDTPQHVVDREKTAEALAPVINMEKEEILELLNRDSLYQVELGPGGKNITELTKETIEDLKLPGIDFIQTSRRYYPNNDFLSYTLGYVAKKEEKLLGEMGIEKYYNDYLEGQDGYLEYQKDLNGYKIPNTPEFKEAEEDGTDIYLTIDENIQMFIERIIKNTTNEYDPDWMLMIVLDAKTGKILGTGSSPSFDPNIKNIESYLNPLVEYAYEPGSTMKTFTYMAAMEKGTYNGEEIFMSGSKEIGKDTIGDWNDDGWGEITYDMGYALSSNVGIANMMEKFLTKDDLMDYLKLLGFGEKTGITLPGEVKGKINFKYDIEVANAGFGQGITINPIQYVQALTSIANEGIMLRPYIVEKIVNSNNGEIVYQGGREEIRKVAEKETIDKIKELMYNVINGEPGTCTGSSYKVEGYDIIGKTGTAQYVNPSTGKYYTGANDYIRSFAGMFPKDDPEVIIYNVIKRPDYGESRSLINSSNKLINDIAKYLSIYPLSSVQETIDIVTYDMPNVMNQNVEEGIKQFSQYDNEVIVIGDGDKIINQYPSIGSKVNSKDRIFIVTNSTDILMPNVNKWSRRDVLTYCSLVQLVCEFNGSGYVSSQSIGVGNKLSKENKLNVELTTEVE